MIMEQIKQDKLSVELKYQYIRTIKHNPYVMLKPYPKQSIPVFEASKDEVDKAVNSVLVGAGGYGGKSILGGILAVQYLMEPDYTCLVTRRNYAELLDTNSIWENLVEWCCDAERLKPYEQKLGIPLVCEAIKTPTPKIIAPNGNTIYFKAFDRADKKQKFKSASYDRIINDEASELPPGILQFQYRSMRNTSQIPRSIINLSNPGGESTDYLIDNFVDGENPYIPLDWRDNPFIDKRAYEQSLNQLDYIDKQYQMYGNWHYKASAGDLIDLDTLNKAYEIGYLKKIDEPPFLSVIAVDMAGKGRDRFVATHLALMPNGIMVREDSISIEDAYPEDKLYNFVEDKCSAYKCYRVIFEQEPGGDSVYSLRYWRNELSNLSRDYGVTVADVKPFASKYNRARPLAKAICDGRLKFNSKLKTDTMKDGLFDQFISISPNLDEMRKLKSPDELDSLGYAFYELDKFTPSISLIGSGGKRNRMKIEDINARTHIVDLGF